MGSVLIFQSEDALIPMLHLLERSQLQWLRRERAKMKIEIQSDFVEQMGEKLKEVIPQALAGETNERGKLRN